MRTQGIIRNLQVKIWQTQTSYTKCTWYTTCTWKTNNIGELSQYTKIHRQYNLGIKLFAKTYRSIYPNHAGMSPAESLVTETIVSPEIVLLVDSGTLLVSDDSTSSSIFWISGDASTE